MLAVGHERSGEAGGERVGERGEPPTVGTFTPKCLTGSEGQRPKARKLGKGDVTAIRGSVTKYSEIA